MCRADEQVVTVNNNEAWQRLSPRKPSRTISGSRLANIWESQIRCSVGSSSYLVGAAVALTKTLSNFVGSESRELAQTDSKS